MIQLSNLTKSFGDRVLFDNVTWQITDRERVGLCGPNGAGKTTLLRMMAGIDEPDSGGVLKPSALTVGYLPQDGLSHTGRSVFEEASSAFEALLAMKHEMHALEARLGDDTIPEPEHEEMLSRYSDLQDRFRLHGGYNIESKVATVLQGLGFSATDFERRTETFSGGWQMRIALAKLLLNQPNLLLLDEPTNHLDLEARNWLETYLHEYPHAVILVSHDRFFLDAVVTRIADLTLRTLTDYVGTYSDYIVQHEARIDALRKAKHEQDEEVARIKMFVDRFRYQATKASQVQSRIKMLDKIVPIEVPPEHKRIHFDFPTSGKSGRTVLELKAARKAYGPLVVFDHIDLHVERGDRIALVGPNGAGKSTLMRMLSGEEVPDHGERVEGHNVVMQYFAQDEATRMDPEPTVYETLASGSPLQHGAGDPQHPRRLPVFWRRRQQARARAVGRGAHAAGGCADAAATVEPAAARRTHQPSRSRLEGSAARRARRLQRHADLRLARPLFRRAARDKDRRDRSRRGRRLPRYVREFLWHKEHGAEEAQAGTKREQAGKHDRQDGQKQRRPVPNTREHNGASALSSGGGAARAVRKEGQRAEGKGQPHPSHEEKKRADAEARKRQRAAQARQTHIDELEAQIADCEARHPRARTDDGHLGLL